MSGRRPHDEQERTSVLRSEERQEKESVKSRDLSYLDLHLCNLNMSMYCNIVSLDFTKAFDKVSHKVDVHVKHKVHDTKSKGKRQKLTLKDGLDTGGQNTLLSNVT